MMPKTSSGVYLLDWGDCVQYLESGPDRCRDG